jgi:hypothetical protein
MDDEFLKKVRSLFAMGCSPGAIAHITKQSKNKVNTAIIAIRVIESEKHPNIVQLRNKRAAISIQMALLKLDRAYKKHGAKIKNGKVQLRETV